MTYRGYNAAGKHIQTLEVEGDPAKAPWEPEVAEWISKQAFMLGTQDAFEIDPGYAEYWADIRADARDARDDEAAETDE